MIFGLYLLSPPVLTDGQQQQLLLDAAGNLKTVSAGSGTTADQVQGNVASGATDSGNPVKIGGKYNATLPTFADLQRGDVQIDSNGGVRVRLTGTILSGSDSYPNASGLAHVGNPASAAAAQLLAIHPFGFNGTSYDRQRGDTNGLVVQSALSSTFWNYAAASGGIVNTATAVTVKAAAGASVRNFLQTMTISHDALGAATEIAIRDGAAGTVLWRGRLQTTASEGTAFFFDPPLKGTANTLMEVVTLTAVTGGVYVNAQGFTGA